MGWSVHCNFPFELDNIYWNDYATIPNFDSFYSNYTNDFLAQCNFPIVNFSTCSERLLLRFYFFPFEKVLLFSFLSVMVDRKLKAAKGAFDISLDNGIDFFDTAEVYGSKVRV